MESCIKMWRRFSKDSLPFARIFSESQILSQWAAGDFDLLNSECHIDHLRHLLAQQDVGKYQGYLSGRLELETNGVITNEEQYKAYTKEARALARLLLDSDKIQVVFCTVAASQTPILYKENTEAKKIMWYFKATTVFVDEAGTLHRPHFMMLAMAFPDAKRLPMVGDPEQLPAFVLNPDTKKIWPLSYLSNVRKTSQHVCFKRAKSLIRLACADHEKRLSFGHARHTVQNARSAVRSSCVLHLPQAHPVPLFDQLPLPLPPESPESASSSVYA